MIRIAICDDEITSLELLNEMVNNFLKVHARDEFLVRRFQSPYDLLECLENPNLHFHIYFLDVVMPMFSGIEVARVIRESDEFAPIIYTTGSTEHALSASETSPHQYLVKPVDEGKLLRALDGAIRKVAQVSRQSMLIKCRDGFSNLGLHQIEYVEYRDHALSFFLTDRRVVESRIVKESFSWIVEHVLTDPRFLKPHASYAVNMDHIASMNGHEFVMASGTPIPISKRVATQIKQQFIAYMTENVGAILV